MAQALPFPRVSWAGVRHPAISGHGATAAIGTKEARLKQWVTQTPDGRTLRVKRVRSGRWVARCDDGAEVEDKLLDVALINAIRGDLAVIAHVPQAEYGPWIRAQADQIEREFLGDASSRPSARRPSPP